MKEGRISVEPLVAQVDAPESEKQVDARLPANQRAGALAVAGAVLVSLVAYVPSLALSPIVVRLAIALVLGAWGSVWLGYLAWTGDRVARWAVAFIAWSFAASWLSPERNLALFGALSNDREWLYHSAFLACWAVGRLLIPTGKRFLTGAVLIGIAINALVALLQARGGGTGILALESGRPPGMASSPVFLGGILAAGLVLVAALLAGSPRWVPWLAAVIGLVAAVNLSGSRSGLLIGVGLGLAVTVRTSWKRALAFLLAAGVGLLLATVGWSAAESSAGRLTGDGGGGGVGPRVQMWEAGVEAVAERPLTGYGDGRFRAATSPRADAAFARAEGPDRPFFDAHNIAVEVLVANGIVGLAIAGGLAFRLCQTSRGPLAWFGLAIAASWLLEPASVITAPLAFLALGASSNDGPVLVEPPPVRRWLTVGAAVIAALAIVQAARILDTARLLAIAEDTRSTEAIGTVRTRFPRDPTLADVEAQIHASLAASGDRSQRPLALAAARRTVALEGSRHLWWYNLARFEYLYGPGSAAERRARAEAAVDQGLIVSPWSASLLQTQRELAVLEGDDDGAARIDEKLCLLDLCPPEERPR